MKWIAYIEQVDGAVEIHCGNVGGLSSSTQLGKVPPKEVQEALADLEIATEIMQQEGWGIGLEHEMGNDAQARLYRAYQNLYMILIEPFLPVPLSDAVVAIRSLPSRASMKRWMLCQASLMTAIGSPSSVLPIDMNPLVDIDRAVSLASQASDWPRPLASEVVTIVGDDLGEGQILAHTDWQKYALDAIPTLVDWKQSIQRAMSLAHKAGTSVQFPLKKEDIYKALEGEYGHVVQLVGKVSVNSKQEPVLVCYDGGLNLRKVHEQVTRRQKSGWLSPLLAADLQTCFSSYELFPIFDLAGVPFITSNPLPWYTGRLCKSFLRIFEENLLNGTRTFQQAWMAATSTMAL